MANSEGWGLITLLQQRMIVVFVMVQLLLNAGFFGLHFIE
jgi:hypothetical protein